MVFAPAMQFEYWLICGQNKANTSSASALSPAPAAASTVARTDNRGRAVPAFAARDIAVVASHRPAAPMTSVTAKTTIPRRMLSFTISNPTRLIRARMSAANARCCSTGLAGLRVGGVRGGVRRGAGTGAWGGRDGARR
jgi:hypothetical protein